MANIQIIKPLDQPLGKLRLLEVLKEGLKSESFNRLDIIVAYAKSGPILRILPEIRNWTKSGKKIRAIFGYDQKGTSAEAFSIAQIEFNEIYATRESNITFHPKIYFFDGPDHAKIIIGSNNLTVGGTETNFESSIIIDLDKNTDQEIYDNYSDIWSSLQPAECAATHEITSDRLRQMIAVGDILNEQQLRKGFSEGRKIGRIGKSGLAKKPASPIPTKIVKEMAANRNNANFDFNEVANDPYTADDIDADLDIQTDVVAVDLTQGVNGLAIQIKPHNNGEIFLSKLAVTQNPNFFGWPFTGSTIPKIPTNPSYPQRTPDPVVNITIYGSSDTPLLTLNGYSLNTVYYSAKSEIRITASPIVGVANPYSILVMTISDEAGIDYEMTIFNEDSLHHADWYQVCNQSMPSGGSTPRKFGWF